MNNISRITESFFLSLGKAAPEYGLHEQGHQRPPLNNFSIQRNYSAASISNGNLHRIRYLGPGKYAKQDKFVRKIDQNGHKTSIRKNNGQKIQQNQSQIFKTKPAGCVGTAPPAFATRRGRSQRPTAKRGAWIPGHGPEKQKHVSASIVRVVTGYVTPSLKTTNKKPDLVAFPMLAWAEDNDFADTSNSISLAKRSNPAASCNAPRSTDLSQAANIPQPLVNRTAEQAKADRLFVKNIGKIPFFAFMVWTFVLIGRPQDYFSVLMPLRPALLSAATTLILMMFSRVQVPKDFKTIKEVRLLFYFFLIMVVGIPFAVHRRVAFDFAFTLFPTTLIYFFAFLVLVNSAQRLTGISLVGALAAVFTSFMYARDTILAGHIGQRIYASQMYDPNDIAFVFATFLPLTIYFSLAQRAMSKKIFFLAAAASMAIGIVLTQSRGGILALLVIILSMLVLKSDVWRHNRKFLVILLLAICMIYFYPVVKNRFQNIGSDYNISAQGGRLQIWKENLGILFRNPVFGVGANCSSIALGLERAKDSSGLQAWQVPHSSIIQVAVETGVPGLIIYVLLNYHAIGNFRRLRKRLRPDFALFTLLLEISFYGFWTSALFLTHGYSIILFFLLAISASARSLANNDRLPLFQNQKK